MINKLNKTQHLENQVYRMQIGKNGINQGVLQEIEKNLKKKKIIKIKLLRYFLDTIDADSNKEKVEMVAKSICDKTNSEIIQKIGFTITICRQKKLI